MYGKDIAKMQYDENNGESWQDQSESIENEPRKGIFRSIYDFLSSLLMGCFGLIVFFVCWKIVFRHGNFLADVSILEWLVFFWLIYCFIKAKELAVDHGENTFLYRWRLFAMTGWLAFWSSLAYLVWFKWGSDNGFQKIFFASNIFEYSLLIVVCLGSGLGYLVNVEFENEPNMMQETKDHTKGEFS